MNRRRTLPISLYVAHRTVVVVATDDSARNRVQKLQQAGATVVEVQSSSYSPKVLTQAWAVIAQTNDRAFDTQIVQDGRTLGILCYGHDLPDISDFAMPAIAQHGPLKIAISTDGVAPALARRLREQLSPLLDKASSKLNVLLNQLETLRRALPSSPERSKQLYALASRLILRGDITVLPADQDPTPGS